ncbi:MAG: carboxypeptidase regulatory-like domain-containing protein, partial [Rhodocyclaceae bacterium]|nr:carboxypeptidase regulatory-like domain-containing protein [Rhodocyclaceae bacterium]
AAESAAPGRYPLRVTATGPTSAGSAARTASASLTVLPRPAEGLTGVTGRFIDASGAPIAGIIVRADLGLTAQNPETRTDAAGTFVLTGLPAGSVSLRFDATPAHPLYPIWPQQVALTAGRMLAMEDWVLKPPPPAERFSAIQPNSPAEQVVTDPRFPGLEIRIPAGVSITGWDGVPKTRIAVERLDPGSLPVASPPIKTKSVYQLFFGSAMGGVPSQPIPITLPNDLGLVRRNRGQARLILGATYFRRDLFSGPSPANRRAATPPSTTRKAPPRASWPTSQAPTVGNCGKPGSESRNNSGRTTN